MVIRCRSRRLTTIVIGLATTILLVALAIRLFEKYRRLTSPKSGSSKDDAPPNFFRSLWRRRWRPASLVCFIGKTIPGFRRRWRCSCCFPFRPGRGVLRRTYSRQFHFVVMEAALRRPLVSDGLDRVHAGDGLRRGVLDRALFVSYVKSSPHHGNLCVVFSSSGRDERRPHERRSLRHVRLPEITVAFGLRAW